MYKHRIRYLLNGYLSKTITQPEQEELLRIMETTPDFEIEEIITELIDIEDSEKVSFEKWNSLISGAISSDKPVLKVKKINTYRYLSAAAIFIIIGVASFFYINNKTEKQNQEVTNVIKPGGNKATLIIGGGKEISLTGKIDTAQLFALNPAIKSVAGGSLVYDRNQEANGKAISTNILKIPKGGKYTIVLPDGTVVWLNSESELKFPSVFSEDVREVELKGEAYFEVAKYEGKKWAFNVKSANHTVQVLGTKFNISAYDNESSIKTSLIEGKVKIVNAGSDQSFILKPGEEATLNKSSNEITVYNAEVSDAIAWKEGLFVFNNENVVTAMNKIARWYDVEIAYQGDLKDKALWGTASRSENIESLLKTLGSTGVAKFKIEGRRVLVMP